MQSDLERKAELEYELWSHFLNKSNDDNITGENEKKEREMREVLK